MGRDQGGAVNETKWTPGPWVVEGTASATVAARHDGAAEIAEVIATGSMTHGERRANAHLIAAAPDLYAALADLLSCASDRSWAHITSGPCRCKGCSIDRAEAALSRARGES
jgi:hypothetical protein